MHNVFIVNPVAGKGRALQIASEIESRFNGNDQTYEISITKAPGHAKEIAKEAAFSRKDIRLFSVGGDGTLNEVINGIAGSNAELGIIPCGSGNDFARTIYPVTDPLKLIKVLPLSGSTPVDLGRMNDRYFINIASIGFDADVVLNRNYFKSLPLVTGSASYILGVLATLIKCKKYNLKIRIDGHEPLEKNFLLSIFANGSYYGGGMKAAPSARYDDGILDFYLVDALTRRKILKFFPLFRKGEHETMKECAHYKGAKAIVESVTPFPVNIDGELSMETKVSVELLAHNIKIIIP